MSTARITVYGYAALAAYVLLLLPVTTLTLTQLLPALLQLALTALAFIAGYAARGPMRPKCMTPDTLTVSRLRWSGPSCVILGTLTMAASIAATAYYTGMSPVDVVGSLDRNRSMYSAYQAYNSSLVAAGGGGALSPFFALRVFVTAMSLVAVFSIIARGDKILRGETFLLMAVIGAQAYSGFARGTGFEFFQIGAMIVFAIAKRPTSRSGSLLRRLLIGSVGISLSMLYMTLLTIRSMGNPSFFLGGGIEVRLSPLGTLLGTGITHTLLGFYSYFGFGFHYVSIFWTDLWLASPQSAFAGIMPFGFIMTGVDVLGTMPSIIDMGPRWHPDAVRIVSVLGVVGLSTICLLLGRAARTLDARPDTSALIFAYFAFLQMLALPIGNFVWVDRANLVVLAWLVGVTLLRWLGLLPPTFRQFLGRGRREGAASREQDRSGRSIAAETLFDNSIGASRSGHGFGRQA